MPRGRNAFIPSMVVRNLQIIGEAASRITEETQQKLHDIPWGKMIGMRHVLVHGYFEIDLEIVWSVIENDLPELDKKVREAVKMFE